MKLPEKLPEKYRQLRFFALCAPIFILTLYKKNFIIAVSKRRRFLIMDETRNARSGMGLLHMSAVISFAIAAATILMSFLAIIFNNQLEKAANSLNALDGAFGAAALIGILAVLIAIAAIVGFVIEMVGLNTAGKDDQGYKQAFNFVWIGIAVSIIASIAGKVAVLSALLSICSTVISLYVIYLIIETTKKLLNIAGHSETAAEGDKVLMFQLCASAGTVLYTIIGIFSTGIVYRIFALLASCVGIYAALLLMGFYKKAKDEI